MMKKLLLAASLIAVISTGALAQQIAPGTLMGNSRATAGPPRQETVTAILDRALTAVQGQMLFRNSTVWVAGASPILGNPGTTTGTLGLAGSTSGTVTITPQAAAGTPTLTLPNTSGTFAVNASTPLVLDAATGALTCPTCFPTTDAAALTKADDTNVTLTLGGTPATALLESVSITVGWTGTLAAARLNSNVVQSVVNDTNVTGSIAAQALTLGWTGTLGVTRGGTGASTTATANRYLKGNGTVWNTSSGAASGTGACGAGQFVNGLNSDAAPTCATPAGGGDVTAASNFGTDNRVIRSDGTGKGVQSSGVSIDDSDNASGVNSLAGNVIATAAQQETATSAINVVTPSVQHRHPSAAKAWAMVSNAGSPSITGQYNVASVTDSGVGITDVNFTTPFSGTGYLCVPTAGGQVFLIVTVQDVDTVRVNTRNSAGADIDISFGIVCYGDQ